MVQLSDDCFAFGGQLLRLDAAEEQLARLVASMGLSCPSEADPRALDQCEGRSLSDALVANMPVPPFDNSAVDGYAVRLAQQSQTSGRFTVVGRAAAGHPFVGSVDPGQAVQIFTGAPLPTGCDTVFMQEDVERNGDDVVLPEGLTPGSNTRKAGEDLALGSEVLPRGHQLSPADLGLAASLGRRTLRVLEAPRLVLFSSGDEVTAGGNPLADGQLYDANSDLLATTLRRQGWQVTKAGILPDDRPALCRALAAAAEKNQVIVTSGGVSTGEEDHIRAALAELGEIALWRIGIKPGRPVALGRIGSSLMIGLPGNPVAAYVGFLALLRPLFHLLNGRKAPPLPAVAGRANFSYKKKTGRREFVRARCILDGSPTPLVDKFHKEGAGMLSGLSWANGLVVLDEDATQIHAGDTVAFTPFELIK